MKYEEKIKIKVVKEYYSGKSASSICFENNIPRSTFYTWLKPYKTMVTESGYEVSASSFIKLTKKLKKQNQIIEVLKKVHCTVSAPRREKLNELEKLHGQYSVHVLCEALDVDRGTYYNHIYRNKREDNTYQARRDDLSQQIKKIFEESNQIFGSKKIKAVLNERNVKVSNNMVSELMQEMNLSSIRSDSKKVYQQLNKTEKRRDCLKMGFSAHAPNQVWVSDITSFRVLNRTFYISAILDIYSRKIIAYKISEKASTQLITSIFKSAYENRQPQGKLIFHSDRGTQYTAYRFQSLLKCMSVEQSFSPKGSPRHNAVMETFFATLKKEELYRTDYRSINEFKERIKNYMEFYNVSRPHETLQYMTPIRYESMYQQLMEMNNIRHKGSEVVTS